MNTALGKYRTILAHLPVANVVEFHRGNMEQVEPLVADVPSLASAFDTYKIAVEALVAAYAQQTGAIETEVMVLEDDMRDTTGKHYLSTIDYLVKYPQNEAEKEAIRKLKYVADIYRKAPRKDYTAETTAIRSLIRDTRLLTAELALFAGLAEILNRLEQENNAFDTLYLTRTNALEEKRERGATRAYVLKANETFDAMAQIINGLYLIRELDPQSKPSLLQIISILKGQIHAYMLIWHRRAGVTSPRRKDEGTDTGDGGDEGGDGGDGGGDGGGEGEGGGDGYETPDITNPPFGE